MTPLLTAVRNYAEDHADRSGIVRSPIRGLSVIHKAKQGGLFRSLPQPLFCLVVQGSKQVAMGNWASTIQSGDSMVMSANAPAWSRITGASINTPYLALALELDTALVAELTVAMDANRTAKRRRTPSRYASTDVEVLNSALRLVLLLERPDALAVLSSQIVREMHYWLLAGRHGSAVRRIVRPNDAGVALAVALLRAEFAHPVTVERLAAVAGMSPSSLHRHFRAVTSLSPLQFQKQLRLIEARRMMLTEAATVSTASYSVGYESISQFTREYRRMFGLSPVRDMKAADLC